uniref:Uncharacterized protein n=1 Tax=Anguilla anguilla TaxID=7936 RepID=A0A0E9WTG1_ANGAN
MQNGLSEILFTKKADKAVGKTESVRDIICTEWLVCGLHKIKPLFKCTGGERAREGERGMGTQVGRRGWAERESQRREEKQREREEKVGDGDGGGGKRGS